MVGQQEQPWGSSNGLVHRHEINYESGLHRALGAHEECRGAPVCVFILHSYDVMLQQLLYESLGCLTWVLNTGGTLGSTSKG